MKSTDCHVACAPRNDKIEAATTCDGCECLEIEPPATSYGYYLACCTDKDKPVLGLRRVVATARTVPPKGIRLPIWCRQKTP